MGEHRDRNSRRADPALLKPVLFAKFGRASFNRLWRAIQEKYGADGGGQIGRTTVHSFLKGEPKDEVSLGTIMAVIGVPFEQIEATEKTSRGSIPRIYSDSDHLADRAAGLAGHLSQSLGKVEDLCTLSRDSLDRGWIEGAYAFAIVARERSNHQFPQFGTALNAEVAVLHGAGQLQAAETIAQEHLRLSLDQLAKFGIPNSAQFNPLQRIDALFTVLRTRNRSSFRDDLQSLVDLKAICHTIRNIGLIHVHASVPEAETNWPRLGDLDIAQDYVKKGLALSQLLDDDWSIAIARRNLGFILVDRLMPEEAIKCTGHALKYFRRIEDDGLIGGALKTLALAKAQKRDESGFREAAEESLFRVETCNEPFTKALTKLDLSKGFADLQRIRQGKELIDSSMSIFQSLGNSHWRAVAQVRRESLQ